MKKILVTRKLLQSNEDRLKKIYDVKLNSNDELYSQSRLIELSQGCDGILSALTDKLDVETINKLPESVKILSNFAVGFGNIDLDAAKKKNIAVTNTPEVLTDATAEIGVLLILGACRRAAEGIEDQGPAARAREDRAGIGGGDDADDAAALALRLQLRRRRRARVAGAAGDGRARRAARGARCGERGAQGAARESEGGAPAPGADAADEAARAERGCSRQSCKSMRYFYRRAVQYGRIRRSGELRR